jgi:hypothetical protein
LLDEPEWRQILPLLQGAIDDVKHYREQHGVSLAEAKDTALGLSARAKYLELTGYDESNVNAIWHHRRSEFGPECSKCGKLLRAPQATFCAECGASA